MSVADIRARMLATAAPKPIAVDTPAWGRVFVRVLTVAEVDAFTPVENDKLKLARSAARVLCDEAGAPIFDFQNEEDVLAISQLPWADLGLVLNASSQAMGAGKAGNA